MYLQNIKSDGKKTTLIDSVLLNRCCMDVHSNIQSLTFRIDTYLIDKIVDVVSYKDKNVELNHMLHSKVLVHTKDSDIWIILGTTYTSPTNKHLSSQIMLL